MLESKVIEVVVYPKPEPEIIAELVTLQEEISSQPTKIVELSIETPCRSSSRAHLRGSTFFGSYEGFGVL